MENMEVCKVGGGEICGDHNEDGKMVMTESFSSFGMTAKEGKYPTRIP